MIQTGPTVAIVQTEHTFYYYDSNGWEFLPYCVLGIDMYIDRACFILWRSPRNETETPRIVAGFNFKSDAKI